MSMEQHWPKHEMSDDPMPSTSDFVKKLYKYVSILSVASSLNMYRMLEDPSFQGVVAWGPNGDCFVVKVRL
jgi:osomolarity two-component system response regulator SKN7